MNDIQKLIIAFCHLPKGERTLNCKICPQVYKRTKPHIKSQKADINVLFVTEKIVAKGVLCYAN